MINVTRTIISQYRHSPNIIALINSFNRLFDPRADFETFVREIWDLRSAGTWGLDNWGRILNISRTYQLDDGAIYVLDDNQYRTLLFLKAAANITDCSVPDINRILQALFSDRGVPYIIEADTLYMRFVFPFALEEWERILLRQESLVPRPATVGFEILEYEPEYTFGFYVAGIPDRDQPWKPFNIGSFTDIYYRY